MHGIWWLVGPLTYRMVGFMVLGGNFAAKRTSLINMGGFDKTIDFFGEDTDIARRLSKHGKVLFNMSFFIYSSSRRYISDGLMKTSWVYLINFLWPVIFHKPFTKKYKDIRLK
jgi:GT2 family glycosyltransferase